MKDDGFVVTVSGYNLTQTVTTGTQISEIVSTQISEIVGTHLLFLHVRESPKRHGNGTIVPVLSALKHENKVVF